jgi:thioredoxin 1
MKLGMRIAVLTLLAVAILTVVILKSRSDRDVAAEEIVAPGVAAGEVASGDFVAVESAGAADGADQSTAAAEPATPGSAVGLPRLVDLGSDKCVPCKMMAPILDQLTDEFAGRMTVEVIDVRKDRQAAGRYGIRVIPTQIFYDAEGQERFRHQGFYSREEILAKWRELGVDLSEG